MWYKKQTFRRYLAKKAYPCDDLKTSNNLCDTSEESLRKQKTVTNISTISSGERSWPRSIFSTHTATHPLSAKEFQVKLNNYF